MEEEAAPPYTAAAAAAATLRQPEASERAEVAATRDHPGLAAAAPAACMRARFHTQAPM
eukprot:CAMPEP_0197912900 /NCGR_PEP_ID=MMETSP1439-20131203/75657_1 /TAXON_ID=66791 /ORGANISM="Gonyaulax spinifera, Strain CCMP409" /LENGTH=58 /DNA_ID=CAMNT_0043534719 /DNA_START=61 /DNA_END=235 /DNA_ORIENTATION=+